MTDSNIKNKKFITPERAAVLLPVLISSFISLIIVSAFVIPKYIKLASNIPIKLSRKTIGKNAKIEPIQVTKLSI